MKIQKSFAACFTAVFVTVIIVSCGNPAPVQEKDSAVRTDSVTRTIWTAQKANEWFADKPWFVGANFLPSTAINQLEMWQKETFDTATIDKELGWAESLGMNVMRVFLHNLVWQNDEQGFYDRMNTLLQIADKHHIKIMFTIFDSCWDPFPKPGQQHAPVPYV
ncbi:MAG: 1,4-beta-xylanase, partial [Bacteroidetes bacterium]|nr:1,4-beta-xylanase [Bacteroidota bacterium]